MLHAHHAIPGKVAGEAAPPAFLDPLLRNIWRARPDLRQAIEQRYAKSAGTEVRYPMLLHPGYFMKSSTSIQTWQPDWDHPTWTYLRDELYVGATFTHQLVPELADDVFLHGTVEALDATVMTPAGNFDDAVRLRYVIDYGWSEVVEEQGNPIGRFRGETRGHVHYVPDVGPVDLLEDFLPFVEVDCDPNQCPHEWTDLLGVSIATAQMSLTRLPVGVEAATWTAVKRLFD